MDPDRLREEVRALRQENRRLRNPVVAWDEVVGEADVARARRRLGLRPFLFQSAGGEAWLDAFHRRLPEYDFGPVPFQWNRLWDPDADLDLPDGPSVLHVYYPHFGGDADEATARERSTAIVAHLERYVAGGGRVLWTMFEPLTATVDAREVDIWLRTRLAELAGTIHVTHPAAADDARDLYPVPQHKVRVIPHPLLHDVYPDTTTRTNARRLLGYTDDDFVVLAFGALRSQKGADRLLRAAEELAPAQDRSLRVLVAGRVVPAEPEYGRRVIELTRRSDIATGLFGHVPDRYVLQLFRAADLVALPYLWAGSSGVLAIALGLGVPVLGPDVPVFVDLAAASHLVRVFQADSDEALQRELAAALTASTPHRLLERELYDQLAPHTVSRQLAAAAADLLSRTD